MRLLLDSHVVVWWLADDPRLRATTRAAIADAGDVIVSVVTPWELGIKVALGKLDMPDDLLDQVRSNGFDLLPISDTHAVAAAALPLLHRDPFDRMLIAQATIERLTLVTADAVFGAYDVATMPAGPSDTA